MAALVALALPGAGCVGNGGGSDFRMKTGVMVPLTGPRDGLGAAGARAAQLAQTQIQVAIAKTDSKHRVELVRADEGPDPGTASRSATKLKDARASCVVGPYSSSNLSVVTDQVFVPADIPVVSPAASADPISQIKDADLINRTVLPDSNQGPALAALIDRESKGGAKGKKAAIGAYDSFYGRNLVASFTDAWEKLGGRVVATVTWADKGDYSAEVEKLTKDRPDAFVFFDSTSTFGRVLNQLNAERAFDPDKTWGADGLADPNLTTNQNAFGLRGVAPGAPADTPAAKAFDQLFAKNSKLPVRRQSFDAQAFDAYILCYLAAVAGGSAKSGEVADHLREVSGPPGRKYTWQQLPDAVNALESGADIDYEGASGSIDLNERGDPTSGVYDAYRIASEEIEIIGKVPYPPEL
jgi:branched-chain amino acid transport system substrate-binding protein